MIGDSDATRGDREYTMNLEVMIMPPMLSS